jgi:hypothetical protein
MKASIRRNPPTFLFAKKTVKAMANSIAEELDGSEESVG